MNENEIVETEEVEPSALATAVAGVVVFTVVAAATYGFGRFVMDLSDVMRERRADRKLRKTVASFHTEDDSEVIHDNCNH